MKPKYNFRSLLLIASSTQLLASSALFAQISGSWAVNAGGDWSVATNWTSDPDAPGGAGSTVNIINDISGGDKTIRIDSAGGSRAVGIFNIGDNNGTSSSHAFLITAQSGTTLTFNNSGPDAQLNKVGSIVDQISPQVILAGNLVVNASAGEIRFNNAINQAGGSGGISRSITKDGAGTMRVGSASNYTGVTQVNAGTISVRNNTALGTTAGNTIVESGARVYATLALSAFAEPMTISGTGPAGSGGALQFGGGAITHNMTSAVTLGADATISTDGSITLNMTGGIDTAGHTVTLAAGGTAFNIDTVGISGAGSVVKNSSGPVTFNATNSHSVSTAINRGTLTVGASGTLSDSTATLTVNNTNTAVGTAVVLNLSTGADTTVSTLGGNIATPTSGTNTATINTQSGRTFTVNQTSNSAYAGIIAGDGGFTLGSSSNANLTLSGEHIYTGATNVNAGILKLGTTGSLANATNVSIAAGATFELSDKTAASATYTWNTASLSASGAATAATITGTAGGTVDMGATPISLTTDATNPSLTVTGAALALGGNTFTVVVPGPALTAGVYTLVSAASITGTVNSTASYTGGNGLAGGTTGVVSISGNNVILTVTTGSSSPYDTWAGDKGLTLANKDKNLDPDNDGRNNLAEFAFNGDPLSGADSGKVFVLTEDSDFDVETADKELILTVAVRTGTPAFGGTPPSATQATDNITYSIEGSLDLAGFLTTVNVVPTPVTTGLPAAGAGYEYRSFSLNDSNGLTGKGFLRAKVTSP